MSIRDQEHAEDEVDRLRSRLASVEAERDQAQRHVEHFEQGMNKWQDAWMEQRDEAARYREAIASALTSLATGPMKDGYAYAVLSEVLPRHHAEEAKQ